MSTYVDASGASLVGAAAGNVKEPTLEQLEFNRHLSRLNFDKIQSKLQRAERLHIKKERRMDTDFTTDKYKNESEKEFAIKEIENIRVDMDNALLAFEHANKNYRNRMSVAAVTKRQKRSACTIS
jgi:glycogen debranching enzyme